MASLKELLSIDCIPNISVTTLRDLEDFVANYEVRPGNCEAFNTPLLGVTNAYFYPKDSDAVFDMFGVNKKLFVGHVNQCSGINKNFNVTSNEFNLLVMWLIYNIKLNTTINKMVAYNGCLNILKLLMYKFFTGKVQQSFPHGAKESVMAYTIDNLTGKSDIRDPETDTWKKLIYKHCTITLEPGSIYTATFTSFTPDSAIVKSISDIHTRLCRKIVLIAEAYYDNNKQGLGYGSTTMMVTDPEGNNKLKEIQGSIDIAINRICMVVLNMNEFIDMKMIALAVKLTSNIRPDNLLEVLHLFSDMATQQVADKTTRQVEVDNKKQTIFKGYALIIEELIQKTYRRAALNGVDVKSNIAVLNCARNVYSASRVTDPDILNVKNSVDVFMERTKFTRHGTLVSLRLAFILYIMLLVFKKN